MIERTSPACTSSGLQKTPEKWSDGVYQHKTLTQETLDAYQPNRPVPRIVRFFRADDPFDSSEVFVLAERKSWLFGRLDGGIPESNNVPRIWSRHDSIMSASHALLSRAEHGWSLADAGSKNGTFVNGVRLREPTLLNDRDIIECGQSFFIYRDSALAAPHRFRGVSPSLALANPPLPYQLEAALPLVTSESNLHLLGEAGSGKEVVARAIHALSGRSGALALYNCALSGDNALQDSNGYTLSSSALHELESLRATDGGTLFLDHVGELSLAMQGKLLQVLDALDLRNRLDGADDDNTGRTRVRVISASLYDLEARARRGYFRRDLLARLGFTCVVPPLREHKEELGHLLRSAIARRLGERLQQTRSSPPVSFRLNAARALVYYDWPHNIRELRQCVDTALVNALNTEAEEGSCTIELTHLPDVVREAHIDWCMRAVSAADERASGSEQRRLELAQRIVPDDELLRALQEARGNRAQAARLLGVSERTVFRRLRRLRER